jgi:hypothetical protein
MKDLVCYLYNAVRYQRIISVIGRKWRPIHNTISDCHMFHPHGGDCQRISLCDGGLHTCAHGGVYSQGREGTEDTADQTKTQEACEDYIPALSLHTGYTLAFHTRVSFAPGKTP